MRQAPINKKEVAEQTKMKAISLFLCVKLGCCECKIEAREIKYLWRVTGITRKDMIRVEGVRKELKTESVQKCIEQRQR